MAKTTLIKPLVTEKSVKNSLVYVFEVDKQAARNEIKEVIEKAYKVEVDKVNTLITKGKIKSVGKKRVKKKLADKKKAYVTLKSGEIKEFPKI
jgi:large subunit ribosomal protein L23